MAIFGIFIAKERLLDLAIGAILAFVGRIVAIWIGKKFKNEHFHLRGEVIGRQIVVESLPGLPFTLLDMAQRPIQNVYFIVVRFWNQGKRPILAEHVSKDAPIAICFDESVTVLGEKIEKCDDAIQVGLKNAVNNKFLVQFDCLNADEWIQCGFFVTGDPRSPVKLSGRLYGQRTGFDLTNKENQASWGDRIASIFAVTFVLGGFVALCAALWIAGAYYSWPEFLLAFVHRPSSPYPWWLEGLFVWGFTVTYMCVAYWLITKSDKRKHPKDYPSRYDHEPNQTQNMMAFLTTAVRGKKQMVSTSIYDYGSIGEPVRSTSFEEKRETEVVK